MKILMLIIVSALATASFANSGNKLVDLNKKVTQLIETHSEKLDRVDTRDVHRALRDIQFIFNDKGFYADDLLPNLKLTCDTSSNALINLADGSIIYDFSSTSDCLEAKDLVKIGSPFCDYSSNSVHSIDGTLIHDFSSTSDCKESISRIFEEKNFCDYSDNGLRDHTGKLIYDFSSAADCKNALD